MSNPNSTSEMELSQDDFGSEPAFSFCIISDGHVNPEEDVSSSPWSSNRMANGRNRYVVHMLNQLKPDFVIHLGDLIHPVPSLPSYATAANLFHEIYDPLKCPLHLLPGNHDVGDKPSSWTPAEIVNDGFMNQFEAHFGRNYSSFDYSDCHFVLFNSQLINSGLSAEIDQKQWLEYDLEHNREKRIFMFCHYPPFITSPDEPEHYDNLSDPGRSWLLELTKRYQAEAFFSGHVHNFFYNRNSGTDYFILPSITFFRHDYAELFKVSPAEEFGRNDLGRFGIFWVKVYAKGHAVHSMRTSGSVINKNKNAPLQKIDTSGFHPREISWSNLGIDMRYPWAEITEMPYSGGLDEFTRKKARNDHPLCALWEMGVKSLRIPIQDLMDPQVRERISALKMMGQQFSVFTYDIPSLQMIQVLKTNQHLIRSIEIIIPWKNNTEYISRLVSFKRNLPVPIYLSKLHSSSDTGNGGGQFKHFIKHGFQPDEIGAIENFLELHEARNAIDGFIIRISRLSDLLIDIQQVQRQVKVLGFKTQFLVTLAKENPAHCEDNDLVIANRVAEAAVAALSLKEASVYIDTFIDMDRGYFPRNGLVDRRSNPRMAAYVYRSLNTILGPHSEQLKIEEVKQVVGGKVVFLNSSRSTWLLLLTESEIDLSQLGPMSGTLLNLVSNEDTLVLQGNNGENQKFRQADLSPLVITTPSLLCLKTI